MPSEPAMGLVNKKTRLKGAFFCEAGENQAAISLASTASRSGIQANSPE